MTGAKPKAVNDEDRTIAATLRFERSFEVRISTPFRSSLRRDTVRLATHDIVVQVCNVAR
jgi:hypothetical protein